LSVCSISMRNHAQVNTPVIGDVPVRKIIKKIGEGRKSRV
jgi:hypothetical protein